MLGTRAAINYELGNYKASAEDLSRQMALAQKKYDQSNRETLNEFATLFDVERLDREKAEAQQQAQAERLRRARVFEISLGVILLLASIFIFILTRLNRRLAHAKHAAEQASRMKGVFIRNITHEINTPLNAIVGFAELASTAPENDPERDAYIDIIRENSGFLQKLVDDVLYIADLESSDTPPVSAQADINACCRECIRGLSKHGMAETAIRFLPEREKFTAGTSCVLLTKALTELLRNAVRFTGTGRNGIALSYAVAQDGRSVTFAVEDSGPGVPRRRAGTHLRPLRQNRPLRPGPRAGTVRVPADRPHAGRRRAPRHAARTRSAVSADDPRRIAQMRPESGLRPKKKTAAFCYLSKRLYISACIQSFN